MPGVTPWAARHQCRNRNSTTNGCIQVSGQHMRSETAINALNYSDAVSQGMEAFTEAQCPHPLTERAWESVA